MNPPAMPFEARSRERLSLPVNSALEIINNNGRMELTGWNRPEAVLEIQTRADTKEKLSRVSPKLAPISRGYRLEIVENYLPQDAYDYRRDGPGKMFLPALTTLTIRLPKTLTLKVQSHNGDLTLSQLFGALDITTFNGTLNFALARDSHQRLTAHTFNGKLLVPEPLFTWQSERRQEATARLGRGDVTVRLDSFNGTVCVK